MLCTGCPTGLRTVDAVTVISLPTPGVAHLLGELPPGVDVVEWDGTGEPPPRAAEVEFFVGRYNAEPPPPGALERLPRLRVVQLLSAGVDSWLPLVPAGVTLCNARGVHGGTTAELAVAGMLAVLRRLPEFVTLQTQCRWEPLAAPSVVDRRVLVVGAGDIGERIAGVCRVLGAEVTTVARTAREGVHGFGDLPRLLPAHDVVALAAPLTEQTRGMVDAAFLAAMPDGALLVNVARGPIVDTDALLAELTARRLHAFLDVTDPEPLPHGHPLWTAPNLLLTPHVGGGTVGWTERAYRLVGEQVRRYVSGGKLANQVDAGY